MHNGLETIICQRQESSPEMPKASITELEGGLVTVPLVWWMSKHRCLQDADGGESAE